MGSPPGPVAGGAPRVWRASLHIAYVTPSRLATRTASSNSPSACACHLDVVTLRRFTPATGGGGGGHRSGLITITAFKVTSTALYLGLLWFALHSIFHCRRLFFGPCEVGMREGGNPKSLGGHARKGGDCAQPTLELTGKSRNTSSLPCCLLSK